MGDILQFSGITKVEVSTTEMLEAAMKWEMTKCVVVGINEDGELCFGGSFSDISLINLLLDRAKQCVLSDDMDDGERIIG